MAKKTTAPETALHPENINVMEKRDGAIQPGVTYVFFVPPGWLLGGTVDSLTADGCAILKDCVYLESSASGHATVHSLPAALTAKEMTDCVPRSWSMPDGTFVRVDAILFANPCKASLAPLARAKSAEAIQNA